MSKDDFIALYCEWRDPKLTRKEFDELYVSVPCDCGTEHLWGCKGWRLQSRKSQSRTLAQAS